MIIIFVAVDESQIRDFENGVITEETDRIALNQIDRVFNILTEENEYSP